MKNAQFREKFLQRTSEMMAGTLSNENVVARIDYYEDLLDPEVPRERQRWGSSYEAWQGRVQELKDFLENGHLKKMITKLDQFIDLTQDEKNTYFGRWLN